MNRFFCILFFLFAFSKAYAIDKNRNIPAFELVIEINVMALDVDQGFNLRSEIENSVNLMFKDKEYHGSCSPGSYGFGTTELFCEVPDFEGGKKLISDFLGAHKLFKKLKIKIYKLDYSDS